MIARTPEIGTERPSAPRRILGIDPGLHTTGYGVIEVSGRAGPGTVKLIEAGIVRSRRGDRIEKRLGEIFTGIQEVIEAHRPGELALEQLFSHYDRPRTAILMGHARGVICLAAARYISCSTRCRSAAWERIRLGSL